MTLDIRPMSESDLATAIGWAAAEGWNPGLADAGPFRAEDPGGFLGSIIYAIQEPAIRRPKKSKPLDCPAF